MHERRFCTLRKVVDMRSSCGLEVREVGVDHQVYLEENDRCEPGAFTELPETDGAAIKYYEMFQRKAQATEDLKERGEVVLGPIRKAELAFITMAKKWYVIVCNPLILDYMCF